MLQACAYIFLQAILSWFLSYAKPEKSKFSLVLSDIFTRYLFIFFCQFVFLSSKAEIGKKEGIQNILKEVRMGHLVGCIKIILSRAC